MTILFALILPLAAQTLTQVCAGTGLSCGGQSVLTARGFQWTWPYDHINGGFIYHGGGSPNQATIYSEAVWLYTAGLRTWTLKYSDTNSAICEQSGSPGNTREPRLGHPQGYVFRRGDNMYFTRQLCEGQMPNYTSVYSMTTQTFGTGLSTAPTTTSLQASINYVSGQNKAYYCCGNGNSSSQLVYEFDGTTYTDITSSIEGEDTTCTTSTHCPPMPLTANAVLSDGTSLWSYGGCNGSTPGNGGINNCSGTKVNDLFKLNLSTLKWTKISPSGTKPVSDNSSYPLIAYDSTRGRFILYADTETWHTYTIATNTWAALSVSGDAGPVYDTALKQGSGGNNANYDPVRDIMVMLISFGQTNSPAIWELAMGGGTIGGMGTGGKVSIGGKVTRQ